MPWIEITRFYYDRSELRYASDCRDEEWGLIAPLLTLRSKVERSGMVDIWAVWEAIQYTVTTGCGLSDYAPIWQGLTAVLPQRLKKLLEMPLKPARVKLAAQKPNES